MQKCGKSVISEELQMTASEKIDKKIADHPDWQGKLLADIRQLVREADPEILEEVKWREAPAWSHNGLVCVANVFKDTVKVVFARGANLADPNGVFNSELAGNAWRGITFSERDKINGPAFRKLVRSAVELNNTKKNAKSKPRSATTASDRRRK
jgi:hypothetical protein